MMVRLALCVALVLAGCAPRDKEAGPRLGDVPLTKMSEGVRLGPADFGDMGTTAAGVWSGVAEEANPLFAWSGDAVPFVGLAGKWGLKKLFVATGSNAFEANLSVETGGAVGTCANIATLAGAAAPPALAIGVACGLIYRSEAIRKEREAFSAWQAAQPRAEQPKKP
jgi:hypothetical protein